MIIVFHSLYFVIKFALKWYHKRMELLEFERISEQRRSEELQESSLPLDPEECFVFPTPVYRQRYSTVQDVLLDKRWRKDIKCVLDFGCAEFGFFQYVKHLIGVNRIIEVDIDEALLNENKFRVMPLTADYLKERSEPLVVEILVGSIADPDWRLKSVDAIVGIEIIEHLYPDTLDALPYNIFGYAKPKLAIFTTPNADFNVLFPNFKGFRHDDHKFEWSRQQFEDWCYNIVSRFPDYSVTFSGIGKGPPGTESLGCCSQMAVFVKEYSTMLSEVPEQTLQEELSTSDESFGVCTRLSYSLAQKSLLVEDLFNLGDVSVKCCDSTNDKPNSFYKILDVIEYPFTEDTRTCEEKILHAATYQILRHSVPTSRFFNEMNGMVEIPLYELIKNFEGQFCTESEIRDLLAAADFKIAECVLNGSGEHCLCVQHDIHMDGATSKEGSDYDPSDPNDEEDNDALNDAVQHDINSSNNSDWELDEQAPANATKDEVATPSDPLVDSGYQKSLSNAEWSPQSPIEGHFEDQFAVTKLDVNDIKDSIKVIPDNNPFPNWLLQLFGGSYGVGQADEDVFEPAESDEAHFYCQGDGLGVHPSIVEVDVDTSSASSSTDEAQAERTISEDDVGSLPTDVVLLPETAILEVVGRTLDLPVLLPSQGHSSNMSNDSAGEEFFDTIDEPTAPRAPQCPSNDLNASK